MSEDAIKLPSNFSLHIERDMVGWVEKYNGLLNMVEFSPKDLGVFKDRLELIKEKMSLTIDPRYTEKTSMLEIEDSWVQGYSTALVYKCPGRMTDLLYLILEMEKPSQDVRRNLAKLVVQQAESMYLGYGVLHGALQPASFLFSETADGPDLTRIHLAGWLNLCSSYSHPEFRPETPRWIDDMYALLIILSEIIEWKPFQPCNFRPRVEKVKSRRRQLIMSSDWRGDAIANIFVYGFEFLERPDIQTSQRSNIQEFYSKLSQLLSEPWDEEEYDGSGAGSSDGGDDDAGDEKGDKLKSKVSFASTELVHQYDPDDGKDDDEIDKERVVPGLFRFGFCRT